MRRLRGAGTATPDRPSSLPTTARRPRTESACVTTCDHSVLPCPRPSPRYPNPMSFLNRALSMGEAKKFKSYQQRVVRIGAFEEEFEHYDDAELREAADALRERARGGESLDDLLYECFAIVREAGKRAMGMRHFDVQMIGGMVLHDGAIAEMKTGEGKTLTATLAVVLNSLAGRGVHLVTVNDHLARRNG